MVMAKKIVFEIIADSDCTTLKTGKKVVFRKVSVCVSVCLCVCVCVCLSVCSFFSMANDNSRKFKQNQIMFRIQPWIVEFSRPIVFGEDRLRERGSLPATFYVLTRVFSMANDKSRKFKQNQIRFCIQHCLMSTKDLLFLVKICLLYTSRCV